jgi:VIT1/CCC1 family predicted Fe2+/Mn2+ transporter
MSTEPSKRDRTRPAELLGLSGVIAVFVALVVMLSSRDLLLAVIALGATFILTLVILATLALTVDASPEERVDLDEQDRSQGH